MKDTVKVVVKHILYSISMGCTSFVVMCLSYYNGGEEVLASIFQDFARQSIGAMIVGIACGGTAVRVQATPG